ncbi:hypothetical protein BDZ89DRAFT_679115 [Hymenopellis radicata]|nr:hypothetical protein BDZ89DRAFT_679115 [Hymenopellis radicata]
MPETINERIDSEAWLIFVEPNLPAYVDDKAGPNSILLVSRSSCAYFRDFVMGIHGRDHQG